MKCACDYLKRKAFVKGQLQICLDEEAFDDWQREFEEASREERINKHILSLLEDLHNLPAFVKEQQRSDDPKLEQERREWLAAVLRVLQMATPLT